MVDINNLQELTERELITKANKAITKMTMPSTHSPTEPKAIGAKKLHNGGVVLELSSPDIAQWLRKEKVTFSEELGGTLYGNPLALGRDSAHIILTCPLSDIYAQSLKSATGHT